MFFINPVDTIASLGKSAAVAGLSSGFDKLREHFGLTSDKLKEYATARNLVLGTLAAGGVAAVMINPVTRVALCTLISMTYTMSLITLNLMMIGLYLSWMGMKGLGAVASSVAPMMKEVAKDFMSGYNETMHSPKAPGSFPKPQRTPGFNPQEAAKEYAETLQKAGTETPVCRDLTRDLVQEYMSENMRTPSTMEEMVKATEESRRGEEDELVQEYLAQSDENFSGSSTNPTSTTEPVEEDAVRELVEDYMAKEGERTDTVIPEKGLHEESDPVRLTVEEEDVLNEAWLEGFDEEEKTKAPVPSTVTVSEIDVDEFLKWSNETRTGTGTDSVNPWVSEFTKQTSSLTGLSKHVSLTPGKTGVEDWVAEYTQQQARRSGSSLLKYAGGALVVGAGVYAAWKLFKTMQDLKPGEEVEREEKPVTYAHISSRDMPEKEDEYSSSAYEYVTGGWGMFGYDMYD